MSKLRNFEETARNNTFTYIDYLDRLIDIAVSCFTWDNLPDTVDLFTIENSLLRTSKVLFFEDEYIGILALPFVSESSFDVYGYPIKRRAYSSYNSYQIERDNTNSVIVYNNLTRKSEYTRLVKYARELAFIDCVAHVNVNAQKTPVLIQATEAQKLTMLNLYQKYDGNTPFIFTTDKFDTEAIKALRTDAPFLADKLQDLKTTIWNEALTFLGISNIAVNKKERLIVDEVVRGQGGVLASRNSRTLARQNAVEKINKMFGLNITVEFNEYLNGEDLSVEKGFDISLNDKE